jgi:segregation and condensation protein A
VLALAEQLVAAMERLIDRVSLERQADGLMLATQLVRLRSRLLFPSSPEAAIEAEQEVGAGLGCVEEMVFVRAAAPWRVAATRDGGFRAGPRDSGIWRAATSR